MFIDSTGQVTPHYIDSTGNNPVVYGLTKEEYAHIAIIAGLCAGPAAHIMDAKSILRQAEEITDGLFRPSTT